MGQSKMSSWMCSQKHLSILANAAVVFLNLPDAQETYEILRRENIKSLEGRYESDMYDNSPEEVSADVAESPYALYTLASSWQYQSDESKNFKESQAAEIVQDLLNILTAQILDETIPDDEEGREYMHAIAWEHIRNQNVDVVWSI